MAGPSIHHAAFERFSAAYNDRDVEGCLAELCEDAVWHPLVGPTVHGHAELRGFLTRVWSEMDYRGESIATEDLANGDVLLVTEVSSSAQTTGLALQGSLYYRCRIRDGKVAEVSTFTREDEARGQRGSASGSGP